jgi:hypothetical protein
VARRPPAAEDLLPLLREALRRPPDPELLRLVAEVERAFDDLARGADSRR